MLCCHVFWFAATNVLLQATTYIFREVKISHMTIIWRKYTRYLISNWNIQYKCIFCGCNVQNMLSLLFLEFCGNVHCQKFRYLKNISEKHINILSICCDFCSHTISNMPSFIGNVTSDDVSN
jgi:hypothetical protein